MNHSNKEPSPISEAELSKALQGLKRFTSWPDELKTLIDANTQVKAPQKSSLQFQMVNFLLKYNQFAFNRTDLEKIAAAFGMSSNDIIQSVNKTTQWGLSRWAKRIGGKTYYAIPSISYTTKHTRAVYEKLDNEAKKASEQKTREYYLALAKEDEYELGHKDPNKEISADNFVMQPRSINRPSKNKFIFDDNGIPKLLNPVELARDPRSFYSDNDLKIIMEGIKAALASEK